LLVMASFLFIEWTETQYAKATSEISVISLYDEAAPSLTRCQR
jgi:hypothetical protein